jgi:hypothetical protein
MDQALAMDVVFALVGSRVLVFVVFLSGSRILGSRISNFTYNVQPTIVQRFLVLLSSAQPTTYYRTTFYSSMDQAKRWTCFLSLTKPYTPDPIPDFL